MNNRFLRLFLLFFLTGSSSLVLLSCSTRPIEEDISEQERDLEKFNDIADQFRKKLDTEFPSVVETTYEVKDGKNKELKNAFEKGSKLTDDKISEGLKSDDRAVNFFQDKFVKVLEEVNTKIANDNSNIYVNTSPAKFLSSQTEMSVNLVKVGVLQRLAGGGLQDTLKITRLDFKFGYELSFKKFLPKQESYSFNIILTNDFSIYDGIEKQVSSKMSSFIYSVLKDYEKIDEARVKVDGFFDQYFNTMFSPDELYKNYVKLFQDKVLSAIKDSSVFKSYENQIKLNDLFRHSQTFVFQLEITSIYRDFFTSSKDYKKKANRGAIEKQVNNVMITNFQYDETKTNLLTTAKPRFHLSEIFVAGMKLSGFVSDPLNKDKIFSPFFFISKEMFDKNVASLTDYLIEFFSRYDAYVAFKNEEMELTLFVNNKLFNELNTLYDERRLSAFASKLNFSSALYIY